MDASSMISSLRSYSSSTEDKAAFTRGGIDGNSSDDSTSSFPPRSLKKNLRVGEPDTVTNVAYLLQADLNDADIAERLKASPHSTTQQLLIGMSEEAFVQLATDKFKFSREEAAKLVSDVQGFVQNLLDNPQTDHERQAKETLERAKSLPPSASTAKIVATNAAAGVAGYLTSFFFGKLAANLLVPAVGPQGGWVFPVVAGLLNVFVSEPAVTAIRSQGAFHPSLDGAAYTEYHTACVRLKKAKDLDDRKATQRWTKEVARIVDGVITREEDHKDIRFRSGVAKPNRDADGVALDQNGNEDLNFTNLADKVIAGARKRSFVTDELPFNFFTVNYFISGSLAPFFRDKKFGYSPYQASGIDLAISAALGMLSGAETAVLQNYLRKFVQKAPLRSLNDTTKEAQNGVESASHHKWDLPMVQIKACEKILEERLEALELAAAADGDVSYEEELKKAKADLAFTTGIRKQIATKKSKAKRIYAQKKACRHRCTTEFLALANTYVGEKSVPPQPMQGRRAINKVIAKALATPLSLTLTALYASTIVPLIITAVTNANSSTHNPNDINFNFTADGNPTHFMANATAAPDMSSVNEMIMSAVSGIPLIAGYMTRNLFIALGIEKGLTYLETRWSGWSQGSDIGGEDTESPTQNDETYSSSNVGEPSAEDDENLGRVIVEFNEGDSDGDDDSGTDASVIV